MPGPPVEATTFASLPPEIRRLILQNGDIMGEADFFICTADRHGDDPAMPMQGISHEADLVVRGYYVGGMLYVTKIYGLREMDNVAGFQPEEPHPEARLFAAAQVFDPANAGAAVKTNRAYSQLARVSLGPKAAANAASEWYNEIHREDDGKIKWFKPGSNFGTLSPWVQSTAADWSDHNPFRVCPDGNRKALPGGHRFYADRKTRKLFLSLTSAEDRLLSLRHDASSLRPAAFAPWVPENPREWNRLQTRMRWREEDIRDCEASILHPIPNGRANLKAGHAGTDLLLGLSKDIMIRTDSPIIAAIPILSRIAPPQPDDELLNHSAVSGQLKTPSDKWLACVPADWIYRFQQGAKDVDWSEGTARRVELNSCMDHCERHLPLIGSTPNRITQLIMNNQYKMRPEELRHESGGPRRIARPLLRLSKRGAAPNVGHGNHHSATRRKAAAYCMKQTSFDEIGPLLVACFIAQGTPARDLQCEKTLKELMALCKDPRFASEYAVEGPHVRPTPDGAMVRPREPLDETSAQSAPVSELFDIFGGEAVLV